MGKTRDPLSHFTERPSGPVFIGLNVLRALSIIVLLLVFVANVTTIASDAKAVKAQSHSSSSSPSSSAVPTSTLASTVVASATQTTTVAAATSSSAEAKNTTQVARSITQRNITIPASSLGLVFASNANASLDQAYCDYVKDSTVPSQAGGEFWSILNRVFILLEAILLILSEVGWPKRLFSEFVPMLGPDYGLGTLGVLQALIACSVLSHSCTLFPQVSSWLLFILGVFNMLAGIFLRQKAKATRSLFSWENYANLTPQTKAGVAVVSTMHEAFNGYKERKAGGPSPSPSSMYSSQPTDVEAGAGYSRSRPAGSDDTFVPGSKLGGAFGWGKQAPNKAGVKISFPLETVPRRF